MNKNMNKIELKNYPLSAKVVKEWFMKEMIESFKDETVPSEFKDFMLEQGIEDDKVETLINLNPRSLFDVFDDNDVIILTSYHENIGFGWNVSSNTQNFAYQSRKKAEIDAIETAFKILEDRLKPLEFNNLKEE